MRTRGHTHGMRGDVDYGRGNEKPRYFCLTHVMSKGYIFTATKSMKWLIQYKANKPTRAKG